MTAFSHRFGFQTHRPLRSGAGAGPGRAALQAPAALQRVTLAGFPQAHPGLALLSFADPDSLRRRKQKHSSKIMFPRTVFC